MTERLEEEIARRLDAAMARTGYTRTEEPSVPTEQPATVARFDCGDCGMNVGPQQFHPYWHCVLFKNGVDPRTIEAEAAARDPEAVRLREALDNLVEASHIIVINEVPSNEAWEDFNKAYDAGLAALAASPEPAEGPDVERLRILSHELAWAAEETRQRVLVNDEHRDHSADEGWERLTEFQRDQWIRRAAIILARLQADR